MKLSSHAFQMTEMCDLFGGRRLQVCSFTAHVTARTVNYTSVSTRNTPTAVQYSKYNRTCISL